MPRRVQDIVPSERRSIRDVRPKASGARRKKSVVEEKVIAHEDADDMAEIPIRRAISDTKLSEPTDAAIGVSMFKSMPVTPPPVIKPKPTRQKRLLLWAAPIIVILVIVIGYIASSHYSRATFTIVSKVVPVSVNNAYAIPAAPSDGLAYETRVFSDTAVATVPAVSGPNISTKAQGKVTFYNNYSAQPVRLIAGTRVTNDSAMVYRLSSSIVIPGYTKSGATTVPGHVAASIVASQAGQDYNTLASSQTEFKVVAYANTPKYDQVYAKPVGDISGGFAGTKKTISPSLLASTTATMKSALAVTLAARAKAAVPPGYVTYDSAYSMQFAAPTIGDSATGTAKISLQGTLYSIILKKADFVSKIAGESVTSPFSVHGYDTQGLESLQFDVTNAKDFAPQKKGMFLIHVKGDMKLVGRVPVDEIRKKMQGKSLGDTQEIFKSYADVIQSGSGELVPPWAKIPTDPERISIKVQQ